MIIKSADMHCIYWETYHRVSNIKGYRKNMFRNQPVVYDHADAIPAGMAGYLSSTP